MATQALRPAALAAPAQFELEDDHGNLHSYVVSYHPARSGWPLGLKLLRILGPALGAALDAVDFGNVPSAIASVSAAAKDTLGGGGSDSMKIQGTPVGEALQNLAGAILSDGSLIPELLRYTVRDSEQLYPTASDDSAFSAAFSANYGELLALIAKVVALNFGPLFTRRLGMSSTFLERFAKASAGATRQE